MNQRQHNRKLRHYKIRKKISGTAIRPRLSLFVSNQHFYAQIIDDDKKHTLCSVSTLQIKMDHNHQENAEKLGTMIAEIAKKQKIIEVVFDRGGFLYHGKIAAFAKGARSQGLKF